MATIDSNRLSGASVTGHHGSVGSHDSSRAAGSTDSAASAASSRVRSTDAPSLSSISSIGRPARLTMPPSPSTTSTASSQGLKSMQDGLEKTTRAQVDVARRSFWGKCIGAASPVFGVVLFGLATGGVGLVAGATVTLMAGFAAKSLADTTMSFMNWRNKKAELQGEPPPYPKVNGLPKALREDALATALVGLGVSEKTASKASQITGMAMGLGAVCGAGFIAGGLSGVALAVTPVVAETAVHMVTHKLEHKREAHTKGTADAMRQQSLETLDKLRELQLAVLQLEINPSHAASRLEIEKAKLKLDMMRTIVESRMARAENTLQQRVEKKAAKGTAGMDALAADMVVNHAAHLPEQVGVHVAPLHVVGVSVMALRSGVEALRLVRSMKRDDQKLQAFNSLHRNLQSMMEKMRTELQDRIAALDSDRDDGLDESVAGGQPHPQGPGDRPPPGTVFA